MKSQRAEKNMSLKVKATGPVVPGELCVSDMKCNEIVRAAEKGFTLGQYISTGRCSPSLLGGICEFIQRLVHNCVCVFRWRSSSTRRAWRLSAPLVSFRASSITTLCCIKCLWSGNPTRWWRDHLWKTSLLESQVRRANLKWNVGSYSLGNEHLQKKPLKRQLKWMHLVVIYHITSSVVFH